MDLIELFKQFEKSSSIEDQNRLFKEIYFKIIDKDCSEDDRLDDFSTLYHKAKNILDSFQPINSKETYQLSFYAQIVFLEAELQKQESMYSWDYFKSVKGNLKKSCQFKVRKTGSRIDDVDVMIFRLSMLWLHCQLSPNKNAKKISESVKHRLNELLKEKNTRELPGQFFDAPLNNFSSFILQNKTRENRVLYLKSLHQNLLFQLKQRTRTDRLKNCLELFDNLVLSIFNSNELYLFVDKQLLLKLLEAMSDFAINAEADVKEKLADRIRQVEARLVSLSFVSKSVEELNALSQFYARPISELDIEETVESKLYSVEPSRELVEAWKNRIKQIPEENDYNFLIDLLRLYSERGDEDIVTIIFDRIREREHESIADTKDKGLETLRNTSDFIWMIDIFLTVGQIISSPKFILRAKKIVCVLREAYQSEKQYCDVFNGLEQLLDFSNCKTKEDQIKRFEQISEQWKDIFFLFRNTLQAGVNVKLVSQYYPALGSPLSEFGFLRMGQRLEKAKEYFKTMMPFLVSLKGYFLVKYGSSKLIEGLTQEVEALIALDDSSRLSEKEKKIAKCCERIAQVDSQCRTQWQHQNFTELAESLPRQIFGLIKRFNSCFYYSQTALSDKIKLESLMLPCADYVLSDLQNDFCIIEKQITCRLVIEELLLKHILSNNISENRKRAINILKRLQNYLQKKYGDETSSQFLTICNQLESEDKEDRQNAQLTLMFLLDSIRFPKEQRVKLPETRPAFSFYYYLLNRSIITESFRRAVMAQVQDSAKSAANQSPDQDFAMIYQAVANVKGCDRDEKTYARLYLLYQSDLNVSVKTSEGETVSKSDPVYMINSLQTLDKLVEKNKSSDDLQRVELAKRTALLMLYILFKYQVIYSSTQNNIIIFVGGNKTIEIDLFQLMNESQEESKLTTFGLKTWAEQFQEWVREMCQQYHKTDFLELIREQSRVQDLQGTPLQRVKK